MNDPQNSGRSQLRVGLLIKILLAILVSALVPLLLVTFNALTIEESASNQATQAASDSLDAKALRALQLSTSASAQQITALLNQAVQDTLALEMLPRNPDDYLS